MAGLKLAEGREAFVLARQLETAGVPVRYHLQEDGVTTRIVVDHDALVRQLEGKSAREERRLEAKITEANRETELRLAEARILAENSRRQAAADEQAEQDELWRQYEAMTRPGRRS